jgi:hypothetical protein
MEDEPTPTPCVVVCHTEGCPLDGIERTVNLYANSAPPIYQASCGKCDQTITDITPVAAP